MHVLLKTPEIRVNICITDMISEIGKGRLRWLVHVKRKTEERTVKKKVFKNTAEGKRSVEKPRKRWLDDAENNLKKIGVRGWRKIARHRDAWKLILMEARIFHTQIQWRERESEHLHITCNGDTEMEIRR
jgi:hypothetical protein